MTNWPGVALWLLLLQLWSIQGSDPSTELLYPFTPVWRFLRRDALRYVPVVTDDETAFVLLADGKILALRVRNGALIWEVNLDGRADMAPLIDDRVVYVAAERASPTDDSAEHLLLAIDKRTGETLGQRSFDDRITSLTLLSDPPTEGLPRLFVGTSGGGLLALHDISGQPAWLFQSQGRIEGPVCLESSVVHVGSDDGHLYALDARTGGERWRYRTNGPVRSGVAVRGNRLYVGSFDGFIYCLDKTSGKRLWKLRTGAAIEALPVLVNDLLIVASYDNFVYALDPASGALRWKERLSGRIIADPIVRGRTILMSVLRDHRVVVLRASDGQIVNSLELGEGFEIVAPPVMVNRTLILTTYQGLVAVRSGSSADP